MTVGVGFVRPTLTTVPDPLQTLSVSSASVSGKRVKSICSVVGAPKVSARNSPSRTGVLSITQSSSVSESRTVPPTATVLVVFAGEQMGNVRALSE